MNADSEKYIDHEVRIRINNERIKNTRDELKDTIQDIRGELKDIRKDMHSQFLWTIGTIIGMMIPMLFMFGTVTFHAMKLM